VDAVGSDSVTAAKKVAKTSNWDTAPSLAAIFSDGRLFPNKNQSKKTTLSSAAC
jgi:hypothetical protein